MSICPFCIGDWRGDSLPRIHQQDDAPIQNRILTWDGDAFLAAGLGAMVYPYVLFVTRRHITGFVDSNQDERKSFIHMLEACVSSGLFPSGNLALFEHGGHGDDTCSCVDHCHIHIVDGRFDLMRLMEEAKPASERYTYGMKKIESTPNGPYLWAGRFHSGSGSIDGVVHPAAGHGRQYFRRVLAAWTRSEEWDWRLFPNWEQVRRLLASWPAKDVPFDKVFP